MENNRLIELLDELAALARHADGETIPATGANVLLGHIAELRRQAALDTTKYSRSPSALRSSWSTVLEYKESPAIEPFLREHGREIVELLKALT